MKIKDRACLNCEACTVIRFPAVGAKSEADYFGWCLCMQELSDHYKHLLSLHHVCAYHSDTISRDSRYPLWRESISR